MNDFALDLDRIRLAARQHIEAGPVTDAYGVDVARVIDVLNEVLATEPDEGLLTLSTIHSAKGLEWHAVFVIWAAEGRFPSSFNVGDDEIEEERRLMYVAATRAKAELYLTYPIQLYERGIGLVMSKPSRFISDLPETILRPVSLVEESEFEG